MDGSYAYNCRKNIKNEVILDEHDHLLVMQGDHMGVIKQDSLLSTYEKLIYHKADFVVIFIFKY